LITYYSNRNPGPDLVDTGKKTVVWLGQTKKMISFSGQFPKILMRHGGTFFVVVIISVGSNAVAAYTGNNHACLQHKRFTDNDRDQETYGSDRSGP